MSKCDEVDTYFKDKIYSKLYKFSIYPAQFVHNNSANDNKFLAIVHAVGLAPFAITNLITAPTAFVLAVIASVLHGLATMFAKIVDLCTSEEKHFLHDPHNI